LWPARDVTCLVFDATYANLVWLHVLSPGAYQIHVFCQNTTTGERALLPPFILTPEHSPWPTIGTSSAHLEGMELAMSDTAFAMDGLALLLTRQIPDAA
jgi:hypothetical protein